MDHATPESPDGTDREMLVAVLLVREAEEGRKVLVDLATARSLLSDAHPIFTPFRAETAQSVVEMCLRNSLARRTWLVLLFSQLSELPSADIATDPAAAIPGIPGRRQKEAGTLRDIVLSNRPVRKCNVPAVSSLPRTSPGFRSGGEKGTMIAFLYFALMATSATALQAAGGPLHSCIRALPASTTVSSLRCAADDGSTTGRGFGGGGMATGKAGKDVKGSKASKSRAESSSSPSVSMASAVTDAGVGNADRRGAEERGRAIMEQMRKEAGAQPADPFKKKGLALTPEELAPLDPTTGVMPEVVSQRMLKRVVPFAGLPVFGGLLTFVGFYYANTQLELDLPPQIVAFTTQALLLLSFAGITYGVMSTSWDENEEGSLLGWENVGPNIASMQGQEMDRIAEAKRDAEESDAEKAGIRMGRKGRRE